MERGRRERGAEGEKERAEGEKIERWTRRRDGEGNIEMKRRGEGRGAEE